jgi:predicted DCC family thiol-disulfide oxidoreductase YuxK
MSEPREPITVYYDGACPICVRDRRRFERLAGKRGARVCWFDITGRDDELRALGIDPHKALTELHVRDEQGRIRSELDAYILLLGKIPLLKPLAWFIGLPVIRPLLARLYHRAVTRRLRESGRL